MKRNQNSGKAAIGAGLVVAAMVASPVLSKPVMDGVEEDSARQTENIGRSSDLGISNTSLPLRQDPDMMWSGEYADSTARQSFVIEPGTLALVGLGLIGFGVSRRLKTRRRPD